MLLTKTVKIKIVNNIRKHYLNLNYNIPDDNKSEIEVKVEDLTVGSSIKVECKCDICGNINIIPYSKYLKNIKNGGYFYF
jgi:hypothetical protein